MAEIVVGIALSMLVMSILDLYMEEMERFDQIGD
jgi:hypothetical protein